MKYSIFDKTTGKLLGTGHSSNTEHKENEIVEDDNAIKYYGLHVSEDVIYKDNKFTTLTDSEYEELRASTYTEEEVRNGRNNVLKETDYIFNTDITLSEEKLEEWKTYRQALRDLPTHSNFPALLDSDWPTKPT